MANTLLSQLITQTGLPEGPVQKELARIIRESGRDEATISMDELRELLADYLHEVFSELTESA